MNETLFEEFFLLNLNKENTKIEKFHSTWKEIKKIIEEVEDYVVWRMEWWQYWVFSWSTRDKLMVFIKSIFPLYDHIWVKINNF
jgi:hypothetical protein